jgi:hypothetical protein
MFQEKVVEKIKTHVLPAIIFFFVFSLENPTAYEVIWKYIVEPYTPQVTILRMRIAC